MVISMVRRATCTPRLAIKGQVVWVNREPPEDVGIRWTSLDDKRRAALTAYIDRVRSIEA